jgi:rfaE bifunctional protein nucleotidyltransferase chain/domain
MNNNKLWTWDEAKSQVAAFEAAGKKMVFTNGCFDILHAGHVHYLELAAQLGDGLLVALNTDESVQRLEKSPARPLQSQDSRASVMSALGFVTGVVLFNEDTPKEIIEYITPHILVKGNDYTIQNIVGADWVIQHGGLVKTLEFLPGFSTTSIEKKILAAHGL